MRAVILAGGEGTRLRPLTLTRAKPVVPLLGRPFLAYQLALLRAHGITDVTLACSYRVEDVRKACGDGGALGVRLRYVVEAQPLGTGGGVRNAVEPGPDGVWVLNGDVLTDADLSAMRRFHEAHGASVTIYLTRVADPRAYGLVETAADGRVLGFREKPTAAEAITTDTINAGIYLIEGELLERIPKGRPVSIEREFFPGLVADAVPFFGWCEPAYWRDIGSPAAYREAQADLLLGRVRTPLHPPGEASEGSRVGAGGTRGSGARVAAPSVVGSGVALGTGCRIGPLTVVGDGSRVGDQARVEGSVLWEGVEVGPGAVVVDSILADGVRIGARAQVGPGAVLEAGAVVGEDGRHPR